MVESFFFFLDMYYFFYKKQNSKWRFCIPLSVGLLSLLPIKGFNQSRQHQRQKLFHAANTVLCFHFPSAPQKVENRMFRATKIPPKEAAFSPRPQQLSSRQADTVSPTLLFPLQKPFQRLPSIIIWIFFPALSPQEVLLPPFNSTNPDFLGQPHSTVLLDFVAQLPTLLLLLRQ